MARRRHWRQTLSLANFGWSGRWTGRNCERPRTAAPSTKLEAASAEWMEDRRRCCAWPAGQTKVGTNEVWRFWKSAVGVGADEAPPARWKPAALLKEELQRWPTAQRYVPAPAAGDAAGGHRLQLPKPLASHHKIATCPSHSVSCVPTRSATRLFC